MRSAANTTLARGRHRLGRPGLVPVTAFVAVISRGLFASWRIPGRHRRARDTQPAWVPAPLPVPATAPVATATLPTASAVPGAYAV